MSNVADRFRSGRREGRETVESGRALDAVKSVSTIWGIYVISVLVVLAGVAFALTTSSNAAKDRIMTHESMTVKEGLQAAKENIQAARENIVEGADRVKASVASKLEEAKDWMSEKANKLHVHGKVPASSDNFLLPKEKPVDLEKPAVLLGDVDQGVTPNTMACKECAIEEAILEDKELAARIGDKIRAGFSEDINELDYLVDRAYWESRYAAEQAGLSLSEVQALAEKKVQELKDNAALRAREAEYAIKHGLHKVQLKFHKGVAKAKEVAEDIVHKTEEAYDTTKTEVREKVHEGADFVAERIDDAALKAHAAADELRRQGERV